MKIAVRAQHYFGRLFMPSLFADAVWASLRSWLNDEFDDVHQGRLEGVLSLAKAALIPDRKFEMTMSFRRNTDPSLPASHTAELTFILPPSGAQWIHGVKFDGYRVQVHLANSTVSVRTHPLRAEIGVRLRDPSGHRAE